MLFFVERMAAGSLVLLTVTEPAVAAVFLSGGHACRRAADSRARPRAGHTMGRRLCYLDIQIRQDRVNSSRAQKLAIST